LNSSDEFAGLLSVNCVAFPLMETFTISRGSKDEAETVCVTLSTPNGIGRGECVPYARYGETVSSVAGHIESLADTIERGLSRARLQQLLPPGAARNAVDCALWDLQAKAGASDFTSRLKPLETAFTLSYDSEERMGARARREAMRPILKIKFGSPDDLGRLRAVRHSAPDSKLIIDANEAWTLEQFLQMAPHFERYQVDVVEQPLRAGHDEGLKAGQFRFALCADESCHDRASLPGILGKYDMINIKLDKTGGLTEALHLKRAAIKQGLKIMVGCMVSSSLSMAPAFILAQDADFVDLDGPLLLKEDQPYPIRFERSLMHPPQSQLWG